MLRRIARFLLRLLAVILVLALLAVAFAMLTLRRSFPQTRGTVRLAGLEEPVDVYRDRSGIPHIYAQTTHDLFFAQGYVHTQDRFYQMDYWRHIGSARLAEMFGPDLVETDSFLRTLGWARIARQELDHMDAGMRSVLQAYADGVNAYLADHHGGALSLEYVFLSLTNPGYRVEPWQPLNTLTWAKSMAWDLKGNMSEEITRAMLLNNLTPEQLAELYPPYPDDHPVIVNQPSIVNQPPIGSQAVHGRAGEQASVNTILQPFSADAQTGIERILGRFSNLDNLFGASHEGSGSNNWVISGQRTATGKPFLANDPHLSVQMPSIWYEIGLHCVPKGPRCPYDVTGFSFAGAPSVIVGHNDRIAWGVTNVGPDVMDLYIEKVNPANPNQYEVNGQWVDMQTFQESIPVAGDEPVELTVRTTRHGPIISDNYAPLEDFDQKAGVALPDHFAIALRWTALEPSFLFRAILNINLAQDWDQFREAARDFSVPAQNLVYADVDGNIGYQMPGRIPQRAGGDGRLPVPGWTDEFEWTGYVPFEELPFVYNPPEGYIATANNAVVGPEYPYLISSDWDYGYRAERIIELIENTPGPIDSAYIQTMQSDNRNLTAEFITPVLMEVQLNDAHLEVHRALLQGWDYAMDMESAPAALFAVFWKYLLEDSLHDELPKTYWPSGGSQMGAMLERLVAQPESDWWDNQDTEGQERRDDIFRQAFGEAVRDLEARLGADPTAWKWGDLHTVTFVNATLGQSGISQIENLFNRGPFRTAGGSAIINATSWDFSKEEGVYAVRALPSMRMIVDLADLDRSLSIHTTGQSGHAHHPHYIDFAELWRNFQYHPMLRSQSQVEAASQDHLRLEP